MEIRFVFVALSIYLTSLGTALAVNLEAFGRPALLTFSAEYATIGSPASGSKTITFHNVSKLTSIASDLHKHNQRTFTAFPTSELADAWNTCNAMKLENKLFHDDGFNTIMAFSVGSDANTESGHLTTAPLITQTKPVEPTAGQAEGALKMMLIDAVYSENNLTFSLLPSKDSSIDPAVFVDAIVSTECYEV